VVVADVTAPAKVQKSRVYFKAHQFPDWYYIDMKAANRPHYQALLPQPLPETQKVDYYIHALEHHAPDHRTDQYEPAVSKGGCRRNERAAAAEVDAQEANQIVIGGTREGQPPIPPGSARSDPGLRDPGRGADHRSRPGGAGGRRRQLGRHQRQEREQRCQFQQRVRRRRGRQRGRRWRGMSGAAVAGIVVGSVAVVGGAAYGVYKATSSSSDEDSGSDDPSAIPCNQVTQSGGAGVTTNVHNLGKKSGSFGFTWSAYSIPDRFEVLYEGRTLLDTGSVSGSGSRTLTFSGSSRNVTVRVTGPGYTQWTYTVSCP